MTSHQQLFYLSTSSLGFVHLFYLRKFNILLERIHWQGDIDMSELFSALIQLIISSILGSHLHAVYEEKWFKIPFIVIIISITAEDNMTTCITVSFASYTFHINNNFTDGNRCRLQDTVCINVSTENAKKKKAVNLRTFECWKIFKGVCVERRSHPSQQWLVYGCLALYSVYNKGNNDCGPCCLLQHSSLSLIMD